MGSREGRFPQVNGVIISSSSICAMSLLVEEFVLVDKTYYGGIRDHYTPE
jgi:hypothetical protein